MTAAPIEASEPVARDAQNRSPAAYPPRPLVMRLLSTIVVRIRANCDRHEAEVRLQQLPDHLLKDVGITRAQIHRRVRGSP
jgi:uncharacterized protein YjiS (DUF1127 family)